MVLMVSHALNWTMVISLGSESDGIRSLDFSGKKKQGSQLFFGKIALLCSFGRGTPWPYLAVKRS
jgi:hypothetical protein